jgi:hypothetical protein
VWGRGSEASMRGGEPLAFFGEGARASYSLIQVPPFEIRYLVRLTPGGSSTSHE